MQGVDSIDVMGNLSSLKCTQFGIVQPHLPDIS